MFAGVAANSMTEGWYQIVDWALAPVALIIVACGAAAYVPARRAVLTDPIVAIRHS